MEIKGCDIVRIDKIFQVVEICEMANKIWNEHYSEILSQEQIDYMLQKFQSPGAIGSQLEHGYEYYVLSVDGQDIGYMCFINEQEEMYLSKLYIFDTFRGNGYGRYAFDFLKDICRKNGLKTIRLNVNKNNKDSIAAYNKIGFSVVKDEVNDIGGGYVMDDYVMSLDVQ